MRRYWFVPFVGVFGFRDRILLFSLVVLYFVSGAVGVFWFAVESGFLNCFSGYFANWRYRPKIGLIRARAPQRFFVWWLLFQQIAPLFRHVWPKSGCPITCSSFQFYKVWYFDDFRRFLCLVFSFEENKKIKKIF